MTCPGEFWERDHIGTCYLQRYVELYPMVAVLAVSLAISVAAILPRIKPRCRRSRRMAPLLADDDEESLFANADGGSSASSNSSQLDFEATKAPIYEKPESRSNKDSFVIIRTRSISDKLRLLAELVLVLGELFIVTAAWLNIDIDYYYEYAANLPLLTVLQSLYLVTLVAYRVAFMNKTERLPGHPFTQCAVIYTLTLAVDAMVVYNAVITQAPTVYRMISVALLAGAALRWFILFSSPVGDAAPRIYTVPGLTPSTEPTSSLFRIFGCMWNVSMIRQSVRQPIESSDIWELREDDHTYRVVEHFVQTLPKRGITVRLLWAFRGTFALNQITGWVGALLGLLPTVFVNLILRYIENQDTWPRPVAYLFIVGLFVVYVAQNAIGQQSYYYGRRASVQVRASLMSLIYRKALFRQVATTTDTEPEASSKAQEKEEDGDKDDTFDPNNSGAVINLMSVDTFKIADFCAYIHYPTGSLLEICFAIFLLYRVLGVSTFAGCLVMLLTLPPNYYFADKMGKSQERLMAITDKRIERTNEVLSAIRIIKFFAWEQKFSDRILELRNKELWTLLVNRLWWIVNDIVFYVVPLLTTLVTFFVYVKVEHKALTPSVAFTAMAIFNILRYPLLDLSQSVSRIMSAKVSLNRIETYLNTEDTPKYENLADRPRGPNSPLIGLEKATLAWDSAESSFKLRDIDLSFKVGDLNVIVGPTGSGKTSLLMGLLGEMRVESGRVWLPPAIDRRHVRVDPVTKLADTIAYCPQQAWLINDTLRNNILFAAPYDRERYEHVIDACALRRDLEILRDGDKTKIGDKGIALSGGQKQRVSLARALYSNSRHLILDDCLSAVDSHTAETLYNTALTGSIAANRTIILVSHNVALAVGKAAQVIVMDNGRVKAAGPPDELSANGSLGDDELVLKNARESSVSRSASSANLVKSHKPTPEEVTEAVIEDHTSPDDPDEESRGLGSIPWATYAAYITALGPVLWWVASVFTQIAVPGIQYLQSYWLRVWTSARNVSFGTRALAIFDPVAEPIVDKLSQYVPRSTAHGLVYYAGIYGLIGLASALMSAAREFVLFQGSLRASRILFERLLSSVVRARIRFFDSTPTGRIINRFSKDIESIDQELVLVLGFFVSTVLDTIATTTVITFVTPQFLPAAFVVCLVYWVVGKMYLAISQELKRHESVTRSPIFQQFGEALAGAVSIRAFGDVRRFETANMNAIDTNHRPYIYLWISNRWLSWCSSTISMFVCLVASFFVIYNSSWISAGMAGISLSYAMLFGDAVLWIVRMYAEVAVNMNSMERIKEYIDIEPEAPTIIPESRPPKNWPSRGEIDVRELSLKYAPELPDVIKKVSFHIEGGLKVGIVGRTGAGKSTIITAMFRLLEPTHGSIIIDGLDISTIGLHDLRSNLAIIPQDPTLFVGTLRSNLDPFDEYSDDDIFAALSRVKLVPEGTTSITAADAIATASATEENSNQFLDLSSDVQEGGSNLSQGQRQLLCLARSLLKRPRIMLLDEATASIDYDTDAMIQAAIREQFENVTILTIAHRLRTIADYDRIIVLEMGELAQFGSPAELLEDKKGIFYSMCEKSGELEALIELASRTSK